MIGLAIGVCRARAFAVDVPRMFVSGIAWIALEGQAIAPVIDKSHTIRPGFRADIPMAGAVIIEDTAVTARPKHNGRNG